MISSLLVLLGACEPTRETVHKISHPQNESEAKCAVNCDRTAKLCVSMCEQNERRCFDLQRYSVRGGYNYNPNDYFNSNHFYNCDFVLDMCKSDCAENNLLCYKECGLMISQVEK